MKSSLLFIGMAMVLLAGCGDVRESLGLGRNAPDEFAVVDRPPLSMPPDFGLRPPKPGAPRPQEVDMTQRASDVLFNDPKSDAATANLSQTEKDLLAQTGADKANPDIRNIVDRESANKVVGSKHLVDDLLFWKKKDENPAAVVDAPAEAARIKDAKDKNMPINQGGTPVIERDKSGWLGL